MQIFRKTIKNSIASKKYSYSIIIIIRIKKKQLSICYRLATIYFDEHNYESAIKDLKEASATDDRNLKVFRNHF